MASFTARHEFDNPAADVAAAMTDPEFVASLRLPDLDAPEVVEHRDDGDGATIRARFHFVGHLDPIARRILGNNRISWVQELHVDATKTHGTLAVIPDAHPDRMKFVGGFDLDPSAGGTVRNMRGELSIKVPLISKRAEQHILPGLLRRIDLEADALRDWLARKER
jgi:hypothetical protein